jgi:Fe-S oxidoreductase
MEPKMERFVESLRENITAEDVVNLEACMDCKRCGDACAWYLATGDEHLHPTYKTNFLRSIYQRYMTPEGKFAGMLGLRDTPTDDDLREHMSSFWHCTACGRCTLSCPAGISTRRLVRLARAAYSDSGLSDENPTLRSITQNLQQTSHSFGIDPVKILARYGLFLTAMGLEMPVDVEGAEILFVCPSAANTKIPDYAIKVMAILNAANISYTVSSRMVETGTEADHVVVHHDLTKRVLEAWEGEAERLGASKLLVVECGCDTRTLFADATEILGRPLKFPVIMFDPLMQEKIESGEVPVEKVDTSVTLHDPCHSTRLAGMGDAMRALLTSVSNNFIEMTPNREYNYCCNGGAGGMRLPENTETRRAASVIKANQIRSTGAEQVTTPCVVCMLSLEDTCQTYNLGAPGERTATMLFEVLYEAMEKAFVQRGELDRFQTPLELQGKDATFYAQHSVAGVMTALMETPEAHAILDWLEQDDVVKRHAKAHPEILEQLTRFRAMSETLTLPIPSATIPGPEAAQTIDMPQYQKVLAVGSDTITFV